MKPNIDVDKIRNALMKERDLLLSRLQANHDSSEITQNPDHTELALMFAEKERNTLLTSADQERLQEINEALEKISNGSYGICESCGGKIHPLRLETLPTVIFCIACQREQER